ncbi:MAG: D-2-hydroxyacid dehydrogenase [Lachnospiraceae bacterium]|nr:D-2-hydroxyacid dehydrogenase [Lachnospiraceae bacterium]
MKIVFMEADTLGKDVDLSAFDAFGEVVVYGKSVPGENAARIREADIIIVNKILLNRELLEECSRLRLICLTATGTNNVDFPYVTGRGIRVTNVSNYSTDSVAQHTFALLFYLYEKLYFYDRYVKSGEYVKCDIFSKFDVHFNELAGKRFGIVGLGNIGRRVAGIAKAFGCDVVYYSTSGTHNDAEYRRVDRETLFRESDIISIHAPLNDTTRNFVGELELSWMKKDAILLNLGRGPIVDEQALARVLLNGSIGGVGLDVLSAEPMAANSPLLAIQDSTRLIITPHIGWATVEARQRCVDEVAKNIEAYLSGQKRNCVTK